MCRVYMTLSLTSWPWSLTLCLCNFSLWISLDVPLNLCNIITSFEDWMTIRLSVMTVVSSAQSLRQVFRCLHKMALQNTCLPTTNPSPASLAVATSISHVWNWLRTEDVHLHTPALRIGTHFLLVFLFHLLSSTSKPFSSLSTRLAHAVRFGFFYKKTRYINSLLLLLLLLVIGKWTGWANEIAGTGHVTRWAGQGQLQRISARS